MSRCPILRRNIDKKMNRKFIAKKEGKKSRVQRFTHVLVTSVTQVVTNMFCKQVVTNMFTNCRQVVFALFVPVVVTSLEQAVNNNL
jgi:undecaprenyl pyrophosphate phosphatase UppP